jgi:protein gp37
MAETTNIEWADATFNPWIGCQRVGPGCDHCYAAVSTAARSTAARVGAPNGTLWDNGHRVRTSEAYWQHPIVWNKNAEASGVRRRVFCASLADVFDNDVDPQWRHDLWELIARTPHLDWMLLTKRIGNVKGMLPVMDSTLPGYKPWNTRWPWPNVWIGATVVNQQEADRDIPKLLATPAAVRFLSIEPMLGPIDLRMYWVSGEVMENFCPDCEERHEGRCESDADIDWVIVGGESGYQARPMHPKWAIGIRNQCARNGVPFLFKQWGEWVERGQAPPGEFAEYLRKNRGQNRTVGRNDGSGTYVWRLGKKAAGRLLDGQTHTEFPHGER